MTEPAVYMLTPRGGKKLVRDDFVYRIKNKIEGRQYYSCDCGCTATVVVVNDMVQSARGMHRHPPEKAKIARFVPCKHEGSGAGGGEQITTARRSPGLPVPPLAPLSAPSSSMSTHMTSSRMPCYSGTPRADLGAGPSASGYPGDCVKVKLEPEWVDAGALEPNCELDGQFEDPHDFSAGYQEDDMEGIRNDQNFSPLYGGQPPLQQSTMIPDGRDSLKLHVPGKPNLTITVAPPKNATTSTNPPCTPLNILNPILNRKRGRPRGSAYGSYNEADDRVTTLITDSIIASKKIEKLEQARYKPAVTATAVSSPKSDYIKPRSKDLESVRAAHIVNSAQNKSGNREELEKVCLKLRQEVLALEVQNLKAEREKLAAYRRNIAVRRDIMKLHLELESGIPSECASSGRGLNVDSYSVSSVNQPRGDEFPVAQAKENVQNLKPPEISASQPSHPQAKISVRKSFQAPSSHSSNSSVAPLSSVSKQPLFSTRSNSNGRGRLTDERADLPVKWEESEAVASSQEQFDDGGEGGSREEGLQWREVTKESALQGADGNEESQMLIGMEEQAHSEEQDSGDDLSMLDSVSPDLSVEYISDPGSRQWAQSSNVEEQDRFDTRFDGSYGNNITESGLLHNSSEKEPPDGLFQDIPEGQPSKRRRVENMWEPNDSSS